MIVKMKKTTVLCLASEKEAALEKLRDIGVLHVELAQLKDTEDRKEAETQTSDAVRASLILAGHEPAKQTAGKTGMTGEELCAEVLRMTEQETELRKKQEHLHLAVEQLSPWGDFSQGLIEELRGKGMHVFLCALPESETKGPDSLFGKLKKSLPEDAIVKEINCVNRKLRFAVIINGTPPEELSLPLDIVPADISLKQAEKELRETEKELAELKGKFAKLAAFHGVLKDYADTLEEELEYFRTRDGMGDADIIAYIEGFVPVTEIDKLKKAASDNGWGLLIRDPKSDENPPTLIKIPKIFEIAKPIFDFIGIAPGYREWDISVCFLVFLTIFFGIIVGDAGYGVLFLLTAFFFKAKLKNNEKARLPLNLFMILSISTIIWGFLNGTYFAIPAKYLPEWMRGLDWFTDPSLKNKHVQQLCFIIAAVHLSLGHIWKAFLYINSRKALSEIGWAMLITGNYFTALNLIVYPGHPPPQTLLMVLYGGGLLLTALFAVDWRKIGDIFNYPFGLIGTFVDLLSYIRLFAVGLSSYYIAKSFNDMGLMVFDISDQPTAKILLAVGMTFVIVIGHILNIILAFLGVLVHGIRLNTLEFSNHMALQWLGYMYQPFTKKTKTTADTETPDADSAQAQPA